MTLALDDALSAAKALTAHLEGVKAVAALPDAEGPLAGAGRGIVASQLCIRAAELSNEIIDHITKAHLAMGKARA